MFGDNYVPKWLEKRQCCSCLQKGDKQVLKNYRPISPLSVCGKIFDKLIFNEKFKFFIENDLVSPNEFVFKPGDSFINQFLSITHDISKSFDCGCEARGVFLDFWKAFDKVWHDGIICKLEQNDISGKLQKPLHGFLVNRKKKGSIEWASLGIDQCYSRCSSRSVLGLLLFLIYTNDLSKGLSSNAKLFADDTLFSVTRDSSTTRN